MRLNLGVWLKINLYAKPTRLWCGLRSRPWDLKQLIAAKLRMNQHVKHGHLMRHLSSITRRTTSPSLILRQLKEPDHSEIEKHLFWPLVQSFQKFWPELRWNRKSTCSPLLLGMGEVVTNTVMFTCGKILRAVTTSNWVCFHIIWRAQLLIWHNFNISVMRQIDSFKSDKYGVSAN